MDAKTQADIIAAAVKRYGPMNQMLKAIEEMGELQRAISRMIQHNLETNDPAPPELMDNLIEEIADVGIMVNQMVFILGADELIEAEDRKLARLAERLGMQIGEDAT